MRWRPALLTQLLWELTALPRLHSWIGMRAGVLGMEGWGKGRKEEEVGERERGEEREGREGRGAYPELTMGHIL